MSLAAAGPSQGNPSIPTLAEPSESDSGTGNATPRAAADGEEKKKKRSLFGFGKKKTGEPPTKPPAKSAPASQSPPLASRKTTASPIQTDHPHFLPSSPGRAGPFGSSPRLSSPAGSQIFERDVQESALLPNSPAIPSHIQTENYIPPVLDASSEAITDDHLDPDNVEIITHTSHQPASVAVTGGIMGHHSPYEPSWADELAAFSAQRSPANTTTTATANNTTAANADTASNYGSFDTTDVRRLSFISFADVVQAEQQQFPAAAVSPRESMYLAGLTSLVGGGGGGGGINNNSNNHLRNRSPSPIRSPVGSSSSPPTSSKSGSVKGLDMSSSSPASRGGGGGKPLGSPTSLMSMQLGGGGGGGGLLPGGPTVAGEIAIETMSQALRRTGSGDLGGGGGGGVRSFPTSPI